MPPQRQAWQRQAGSSWQTGGWYWLDPTVALAIAIVVAYHAFTLIRKVLRRLRPAAADSTT
jgi:divalent metal cation (Fe/Co/Zn/Cd) transporter